MGRFLVAAVLLLALPAPLVAQEPAASPPVIHARVVQDFTLDGHLTEWEKEGSRHEAVRLASRKNLVFQENSNLSRNWGGPEDCSGTFWVGYTASDLVIAGDVRDDELTLNPRNWWLGDEIEVFFDLVPSADEPNPHEYSSDDYQLLLFPRAVGRQWGFATIGGQRGRNDGGFDGVRVASVRESDAAGKYRGFTFEVAIPLVNFPGLKIRKGARIGFALALVDADGEYAQKTYMTVDGRGGLSVDPTRFGQLVFDSDRPALEGRRGASAAPLTAPLIILFATLLAVFLLWRFRRFLAPVTEMPVRRKAIAILGLLGLVVLTGLIPDAILRARKGERKDELERKVGLLREVLGEARSEGLLGPPETGPDPARITALLTGGEVTPPESFRYREDFAHEPSSSRTLDQVPVIDYARALTPKRRAVFEAEEPVAATEVVAVVHFQPDPTSRVPLAPDATIGVLRIVLETNGEVRDHPIRYGKEVDDSGTVAEGEHGASDAQVAWRDRSAGTHADEIRVLLPDPETARVARVEVDQLVEDGTLTVDGVTLVGTAPDAYHPLPMISPSLIGLPTNLWRDRPPGAAVVLKPGSDPVRIDLEPPVDRVWLFYVKLPAPPGEPPDPPGRDMLSAVVAGENGPLGEALVLRNGAQIDTETLLGGTHPAEFKAQIGIIWSPVGDWPRHRDVIPIDVPDRDQARQLVLTALSEHEPVLVAGITEGRRLEHHAGSDLTHLAWSGGKYHLRSEDVRALSECRFTWYRDGRAEDTTFTKGEGREAVLGSALPSGAMPGSTDTPAPEVRDLGEVQYLAAFLPVDRQREDVLEASLKVRTPARVHRIADVAFFVFLGLLLLGALLLVADLVSRLPRIRTKLTLGFAVAALVPLLLFFFGLSGILEREFVRTERGALLEQIGRVRAKFEELREDVRMEARGLLKDPDLLEAEVLARTDPDAYRKKMEARLRVLATTSSPFGGPAQLCVQDLFPAGDDPGPRVFSAGGSPDLFGGVANPVDDITYQWSEIRLEGIDSTEAGDGGRRTVAVVVPVESDLLETLKGRFGQKFELLLYTMRGFPYRGTLSLTEERDPARAAARREIAEEIDLNRNPVVREETIAGAPYSVAYDLIRTRGSEATPYVSAGSRKKEPIALLAIARPRQQLIAARAEVRNLFLILGAVILVLEVIVGNILTRRLTDPLTSLSRGARAVAAGRLDTQVRVAEGDEIGTLAESFNRMTSELSRRIGELSKLNAAIRSLSGSLERGPVLERAVEAFTRSIPQLLGVLVLLARDDDVEIAAGLRGERRVDPARFSRRPGLFTRALAAEGARPLTLEVAADTPQAERQAIGNARSAVTVPFASGREDRGTILLLFSREEPGLSPNDLEFLSTMAQQVGIALENARLYQLAIEDAATGLFVHSYFLTRLREETERAVRTERPLSILLVGFEEIEWVYETYGPEEGDHVLNRVLRRVKSGVRGLYVLARADRNTVEVILPEATKDQALLVAREIREELGRVVVRLKKDPAREIRVTPSIGLATCPDDARSAEFLLSEAHQALYKAATDRTGSGLVDPGRERQRVQAELTGRTGRFVFRSEKMLELLETVDRIAASDVPILVLGETGVGKEVLAEIVHEKSRRRGKPLVKVNCAALPDSLLESELFGYERGAFTGADRRKPGRFELADGGTIFLDEIGEIPPQTQVKLLRVLQDHRVERLGGTGSIRVDVRVIAATNLDLAAAIQNGRFREDLYFRLNVVSLVLPPLRARKEEIPALVDSFLAAEGTARGGPPRKISPAAMDRLFAHSWPGNVRELRNTIERACVISRDDEIGPDDISFPDPAPEEPAAAPGRNAGPGPARPDDLNLRQMRLLEYLAHKESITNREYADLVNVSPRTGNRDIGELVRLGRIEKMGKRRASVYRLKRPSG